MTVLIDPPSWPAHGRRWSHLVSDASLAELHAFARRLGVPDRGFEGDHYDLPEERYADAVHAGAVPVSSRELLRRLQESGLRRPKRRGERVLASTQLADGVRVDTLQSSRQPVGPVDAVILVVHRAGDLLVLGDGEGLTLPRTPVRDDALDAASTLLDRLLGPARPTTPPVQLGYLRTVRAVATETARTSRTSGRPGPGRVEFAVVWRWLLEAAAGAGEPEPPALWHGAVEAVALLPADLAPLLRTPAGSARSGRPG